MAAQAAESSRSHRMHAEQSKASFQQLPDPLVDSILLKAVSACSAQVASCTAHSVMLTCKHWRALLLPHATTAVFSDDEQVFAPADCPALQTIRISGSCTQLPWGRRSAAATDNRSLLGRIREVTRLVVSRPGPSLDGFVLAPLRLCARSRLFVRDPHASSYFDDRSLAGVRSCTQLTHVHLKYEGLSVNALQHLHCLPRLRQLWLESLVPTGRQELRHHLIQRDRVDWLMHLTSLSSLLELRITGCSCFVDANVPSLGGLTSLRHLELASLRRMSEAALRHLSSLTGLSRLELSECVQFPAATLRHLRELPSLQHLSLRRCRRISSEGLTHLSSLRVLQHLELKGSLDDSPELAPLGALEALTHLDISYSGVCDEQVERLGGLTSLRRLCLDCCLGITGAALVHLRGLLALERLDLTGCCAINGAGLAHLSSLTALTHLNHPTPNRLGS